MEDDTEGRDIHGPDTATIVLTITVTTTGLRTTQHPREYIVLLMKYHARGKNRPNAWRNVMFSFLLEIKS